MVNTQKQDLKEKLDTLRRSKVQEDKLIAEELVIKNAKTLGIEYVLEYIQDYENVTDTDFLVRVKRKLPGFKIINTLF